MASEVDFPDGTSFKFLYNSYGDLAEVDLPTGGAYQYDYSAPNIQMSGTGTTSAFAIYRQVSEKRIYVGAPSSSTLQQVICLVGSVVYSNQTHCSGGVLGSEMHVAPSSIVAPIPPGSGGGGLYYSPTNLETGINYYDANSNLLKAVTKTWTERACSGVGSDCTLFSSSFFGCPGTPNTCGAGAAHDPQMTADTTSYNGVMSQNSYAYDAYNNKTSEAEYAFGNGAAGGLVRTTSTCFDAAASTCPITEGSFSSYVNLNILDLPLVQTVYTAGGVVAAQTQWTYDTGTIADCSNIFAFNLSSPKTTNATHDSSYGTAYTTRGNATSIAKLVSGSSMLTSSQAYDIAGNLLKSIDPRGVETDFSFADSSDLYALPLAATRYTGLNTTGISGTASGTAMSESVAYDYNIQKPTQYLDFNGQKTTYAYADTLDRITNVTRPNSGQANFTYSDVAGSFYTITALDKDTPGDGVIKTQVNYDGLGRKAVALYNAPEGQIETCYAYDGKNRLQSVSNPNNGSCSTSTSSYVYDVLDRKVTVVAQDGSVTQYKYKGDTAKLTNDTLEIEPPLGATQTNGNNRLSYSDAQGRLVQVDENATSWQGGSYGQAGQSCPAGDILYTLDRTHPLHF